MQNNSKEKPVIKLIPFMDVVVRPKTLDSFVELMEIYECAGWKWDDGKLPTDCYRKIWKEKGPYVDAGKKSPYLKGIFGIYKNVYGKDRLSVNEFCEIQGIEKSDLQKIHSYFFDKPILLNFRSGGELEFISDNFYKLL